MVEPGNSVLFSSLLLDDFHDRHDLVSRDPPTLAFGPTSHDLEFEVLVQADGQVVVAERIGKKGKGELSRSASGIAPAKAGRGMVDEVQPQRQWLGFLAIADGDNGLSGTGLPVGYADISFELIILLHCKGAGSHRRAPRIWARRSRRGQQIRSPQV